MTPSILGIDISSFHLDGALILPSGITLRNEVLGTPKHSLTDRVRNIPSAVERLTRHVPQWVVIEDAYGPSGRARKALDLVTGAIIASASPLSQVKLLKASQWRSYLGAKNTKEDGHRAVWERLCAPGMWMAQTKYHEYTEHELDALGVALGWQEHLQKEHS